jgi:hypothetical protein
MLAIKFKTENEAFRDNETEETVRILRDIAKKIESGRVDGAVMDLNGNKIGTWDYCEEFEPEEVAE